MNKNEMLTYLVDVKHMALSDMLKLNDKALKALSDKETKKDEAFDQMIKSFKTNVKDICKLDTDKAYDSIVVAVLYDYMVANSMATGKANILKSISNHQTSGKVSDSSATISRYGLIHKAIVAYKALIDTVSA